MLQPDMLLPVQACCSRTCCRLFKHVAAGHVAAYSSMLQLDMLQPVRACCSLWQQRLKFLSDTADSATKFCSAVLTVIKNGIFENLFSTVGDSARNF
jgi:fumarate hydratase class II